MKRAYAPFAALLLLALPGCDSWPQSGIEDVKGLLARDADRRECWSSNWTKEQDFEQPPPSILVDANLHLEPDKAIWTQSDNSIMAVARGEHAGYLWEIAVVQWGPDHYYVQRGDWMTYWCSKAAIPLGKTPPPLGEMTDDGTAMDGEYRDIVTPAN